MISRPHFEEHTTGNRMSAGLIPDQDSYQNSIATKLNTENRDRLSNYFKK